MERKKHPLISAAVKAFLVACCSLIGLFAGIFIIMIVFAGLSGSAAPGEVQQVYTPKLLPNHEGKRKVEAANSPIILRLDVTGIIGMESMNRETVIQQLVESREGIFKSKRVKGIILYINTPGGSIVDMEGIYNAIDAYVKQYKIPVYGFVDGFCLSAGMYIASVTDKIYSSDVSLIGSVGVLLPTFMNYSDTLEKLGIKTVTVTAGKEKDLMNPLRPWKEGEEQPLKEITGYYYDRFLDLLAEKRPLLTKERLRNEIGAGFFPAEKAKAYGFIDETGASFSSVLKDMIDELGIEDHKYQVYTMERKYHLSDFFAGSLDLFQGKMTHRIEFGASFDQALFQSAVGS